MMHCRVCKKSNDGTLVYRKKVVCEECLSIQIPCICGCGNYRSKYGRFGNEYKYINGHHMNGVHRAEKTKRKQSESKMGKHRTEESRRKQSESTKGEKNHNYGKHWTEKTRRKQSESHKGNKNWNWQGGITPIAMLIRGSAKYEQWQQDVFKRDNYTCQKCYKHGGDINAHHNKKSFSKLIQDIKGNFSLFDLYTASMMYEPLWDINNGITLCKKCHKEEHKKKNN